MFKKVHGLLALMGITMAMDAAPNRHKGVPTMKNPPPPPRRPSLEEAREMKRRKGLKQFRIDGKEVWAINEKNAIRKAAKL